MEEIQAAVARFQIKVSEAILGLRGSDLNIDEAKIVKFVLNDLTVEVGVLLTKFTEEDLTPWE